MYPCRISGKEFPKSDPASCGRASGRRPRPRPESRKSDWKPCGAGRAAESRADKPHVRPDFLRRFSRENAGGGKSTSVSVPNRKTDTKCCECHGGAPRFGGAAREGGGRVCRRLHETESEFPARGPAEPHETESEFSGDVHESKSEPPEGSHEITSEFLRELHEAASEFPDCGPGGTHETASDFGETPHEGKSEFSGGRDGGPDRSPAPGNAEGGKPAGGPSRPPGPGPAGPKPV